MSNNSNNSVCINCRKEILNSEYMKDGRPAVTAWFPAGSGKSLYAIVSSHINCMTVEQIRQCIDDMLRLEREEKRLLPDAFGVLERRRSELLAVPTRAAGVDDKNEGSRFDKIDIG